jgi:DNA-binding LacI/PurR family transcriptional regulator
MANLHDVAKRAQVSIITVSRVINNKGNVKDETRERVLKAAKELKYYPNSLGRGLNSNKVNTIGIIIATIEEVSIHGTHYYNELMIGIERSCTKNSYDMLIPTQKKSYGKDYDYLKLYFERKIDGLIMVSPDLIESEMQESIAHNIPCVIIGERPDEYGISYVDSDNRGGIFQVGAYLVQKGHRKLAFLTGLRDNRHVKDRLNGFFDVVHKFNLKIPDEWILEGDFSVESGRKALRTLLSGAEMPTALFCANDIMALGVLSEAQVTGVKVPDQLSIIGFDGLDVHRFTNPSLATIRQPLVDMGFTAAEILFRKLKDPGSPQEIRIFPVELLPGGSIKEFD